jgi:hypothetical protein
MDTAPALAVYYDAIDDIERLAASPAAGPPEARLSAIAKLISARVPRRPGTLDIRPGELVQGGGAADAARMIEHILRWQRGPATGALADLIPGGEQPSIRVHACGTWWLDDKEQFSDEDRDALAADGGDPAATCAFTRSGTMVAGGVELAATRLVVVPSRLPWTAWERIQAGTPAGAALGPYGMTRGRRRVARDGLAVAATAVLWLRSVPVGLAGENTPPALARHIARLAGSRLPSVSG